MIEFALPFISLPEPDALLDLAIVVALIAWFVARIRRGRHEERLFRSVQARPAPERVPLHVVEDPRAAPPSVRWARHRNRWMEGFLEVESAWASGDLNRVQDWLAPEVRAQLEEELRHLKDEGILNRLDDIVLRTAEPVDGWEEADSEFVTVHFTGTRVDYNVRARDGLLISGDPGALVEFDEFWTFSRRMADERWIVSAIDRGAHGSGYPRMASLY